MHSIEPVLPIFLGLDGTTLSPQTFSSICVRCGWPEPVDDGIGLWEVAHAANGTPLVLDTVTKPTTLICRLDSDDDYEPENLLRGRVRERFDLNFEQSTTQLTRLFPTRVAEGTYAPPFDWRFAHFQGLNSLIALEQTHYDPVMGVQLILLLQPARRVDGAVTSTW